VERGWLGAAIQDLSPELAASFGYEGTEGVLIGDVVANGPAAKAGLKSGDIVAQFDGKAVKDANELRNAVAATASNTNVPVEVFRDGKRQVLTVHIGNLDEDSLAAAGSESGSRGGDRGNVQSNDLGITVQTLTADLARQLGYDESAQGAVVTNVESGSAAASLGIQPGDVIVAVGHTTIDSAAAFSRAMEGQDLAKGVRMQIMRDNVRRFMFVKIS
jgi:serine protease Do